VATLDDVAPELGLVFGKHDLRHALRSAAKKAGLPASKWKRLSNHDFRHSAITYWASRTTNLAGVQFLAGHRHAATTGRYVNAGYEHARAVLEALGK